MNVLMIGLDGQALVDPASETVERHLAYAERAGGKIFMVCYSRSGRSSTRSFEDRLFVVPSRSLSPVTFPYDAYRRATKIIEAEPIDLIYTQDPFATAAAGLLVRRRFKKPLIIQNHSSFIDNELWIAERPLYFSLLNRLGKSLLPKADAWRVVNHEEKRIYRERLDIPEERIHVLNVPVAIDRFLTDRPAEELAALRAGLGLEPDAPLILWVGRPVRFKRLPLLFRAFRLVRQRLPRARLLLIGDERQAQEDLGAEIERLGIGAGLIWLKRGAPHGELPGYYQAADVYVHTSNYEGFGRVMVEASAAGRPVVATDTAGAREIVDDGRTGFLVPVDDAHALAERLLQLLKDGETARRMGRVGRRRMRAKFDPERNTEAIVEMWRRVVREA